MSTAERPNVLFLFTDDQRFDTIHALGNEIIRTPNMDSLVANGVSFTHATIMGSTMPAVCCPSRAMLMSGRTLYRAPRDLAATVAFPEVFQQAGYTTFSTGKWHNEPASFARCFADGAKIFFGGMSDHHQVPVHDFDPTGRYPQQARYTGEKFSSELFADAAVEFLHKRDPQRPFLLYFSSTAPHDPRTPPQQYADMYHPADIPLPENFMPRHPFDNGEMEIRDEQLAPWPRTPDVVRRHLADYYGMISHLDDHIGRVLEALEATGEADKTIIVFAGDNGLALGQHGLLGKQNLYEHSVRVPLVISGPGLPAGERRQALCYLLDIFPTLTDLIGLETPEAVEGISLAPVIKGEAEQVRDDLFFAYRNCQRCLRDRRYKLIEYLVNGTTTTQLFDIVADPWETSNLAGNSDYSEQLMAMRRRLTDWQAEVDDPLLQGLAPPGQGL